MQSIFAILIGVAALAFFVWLFIPSSPAKETSDGELIDPSDSRQIGMLIGLAGGGIADAAVARFALERFEQIHGRKATTRDVGIVVGLMIGR
jgi:phosphotransferase system  glucose/maltose/N-acetylglucosamine-specific IIC component